MTMQLERFPSITQGGGSGAGQQQMGQQMAQRQLTRQQQAAQQQRMAQMDQTMKRLHLAGGRTSVLGSVSGLTETFAGVDGPIQVGVTASRLLRQNRSLSVTLAAGLTDSAPDYLLSAGWRVGL